MFGGLPRSSGVGGASGFASSFVTGISTSEEADVVQLPSAGGVAYVVQAWRGAWLLLTLLRSQLGCSLEVHQVAVQTLVLLSEKFHLQWTAGWTSGLVSGDLA